MIGTIDLYKLALTPNDTMYFDSVNAQTEWFNNQEHLSIDNISFNGDRAFRLGQNYLDVVFNYNYVRYKLNDRYIYAFIENVTYNNDNTSSLNISIDLNQTFLQELQTAISTSNIGNVTKKDSYFETYKPYDNKLNVSDYSYLNLANLSIQDNNCLLGFIIINADKNIFSQDGISSSFTFTDNGFAPPCACIMLPVLYNLITNKLMTESNCFFKYNSTSEEIRVFSGFDIGKILNNYPNLIADNCVGINFNSKQFISSMSVNIAQPENILTKYVITGIDLYREDILSVRNSSISGMNFLLLSGNNYPYKFNIDLSWLITDIPFALFRQPYMFIRVGNDINSFTLNLLDFNNIIDTHENNYILEVTFFTSGLYPYTTNFKFKFNNREINNRNALFTCSSSIPVPYSVSAWQQYYSTHSASVNDGLATAHKYEREQSNIKYISRIASSFLGFSTATTPKQNKLATADMVGNFLSASADYYNDEVQRAKEKALLDIEWNDIKSSPNEYANSQSNMSLLYINGFQGIEIDLCLAKNIADIIKYHKYYGYKVNRMEKLTWQGIKQHTVFDYISFNTITLKSTLPQFYTAMIEQQYEQGVRFWYDYNNFMNYEIENEEVQ